jgi:hypothetical protein
MMDLSFRSLRLLLKITLLLQTCGSFRCLKRHSKLLRLILDSVDRFERKKSVFSVARKLSIAGIHSGHKLFVHFSDYILKLTFNYHFFVLFKGLVYKLILSNNSFVLHNSLDFKSLPVFFI